MFLPLKDINPTERVPIITIGLIAINVLVFLYQKSLGPGFEIIIAKLGATPYEITRNTDLTGVYQIGRYALEHYAGPKPIALTLLTSMFMHGSWLHLGGNMLYLWIFGNNVEDILGPTKYVIFYLVCGLAAHGLHILSGPSSLIPTVGASGAVSGLLGAYLMAYPRARVLTLMFLFIFIRLTVLPAAVIIIYWFVYQLLMGAVSLGGGMHTGGVAWFAHIGGFVAGIILIYAMAGRTITWLRRGGW
jgi:membrane associated rhomboid family serine protease